MSYASPLRRRRAATEGGWPCQPARGVASGARALDVGQDLLHEEVEALGAREVEEVELHVSHASGRERGELGEDLSGWFSRDLAATMDRQRIGTEHRPPDLRS